MTRPDSRRPGQNRRAQYGLFASYVVTVLGALVGLFLVIVSQADPVGFGVLRAAAAEITRPVASSLHMVMRSIGSVDEHLLAYVNAGSQNAALRRQVDANRPLLIEAQAIRQENIRLRKLLRLVETTQGNVATARLVSSAATSPRRIARISAGTMQGVRPGMPVRAPEGLIGRVMIAGPTTADILLLSDSQNILPVRRASDNVAAICTGQDDGTLEIRPLIAGGNPFRPGDIFVTSGTGGIYRPNTPVAIVVRQGLSGAVAVPLANPARVEAVLVQRPYDADMPAPPPPVSAPEGEAGARP